MFVKLQENRLYFVKQNLHQESLLHVPLFFFGSPTVLHVYKVSQFVNKMCSHTATSCYHLVARLILATSYSNKSDIFCT